MSIALRSLFVVVAAFVGSFAAGCPVGVEVPDRADAGPVVPDGEGEGDGVAEGEGDGATEGEGDVVVVGEGEGDGIIIVAGEGEGEESALPPGTHPFSIDVGGTARTVQMVVPTTISGPPLPVIIALHGNGDNALDFATALSLLEVANAENVVFAVPDGFARDVDFNGFLVENVDWDPYTATATNVDIAFVDALIARLNTLGETQAKGVHVFGYSQGGFMAYRYGLERSASIGSDVVVSAGDPFNDSHLVDAAARPLPFRFRVGQNDGFVTLTNDANAALVTAGHETSVTVVPGAGHAPFPVAAGESTVDVIRALVQFQKARPAP